MGYQDGETTPDELDTDLTTRQVYDAGGRIVRQIDPNGRVTAYRYDAADRLTQVVNNLVDGTFDPSVTDEDVPTNYVYDRAGNRLTNTDANEHIWQTRYDALGRPISMTDPLDRVATKRYDRGSRITQLTRPDSAVVNYRYDAADRLLQIGYPDPANPTETTNIDYTYRADGVRLTMTDATGQTNYGYDALKRLTNVAQPGVGTISYRYTADGNRDRVTYPDGPTLEYRYNGANQITSVKEDGTTIASYSYVYGSTRLWFSDQGMYAYDGAGRVIERTQSSDNRSFTTTYDRTGRPIEQVEDIPGPTPIDRTVTMTYDGLDRLTEVNDTAGNSYNYTYDAVGNRLSATANGETTTYTYDDAHQIATANDTPFTYDANGRLTNDGDQTYRYDALDRLLGAGETTYAYNGNGDLMAATPATGDPTVYVQDVGQGLSQVLQTREGDTTTDYYYGLERFAAVTNGETTAYRYDILGSLRQTRDAEGTATATFQYDPWGSPERGSPALFGFTGELHDQGLVHLRARWYHPLHGTFTTTDPFSGIGNVPASQHPYQYALNSPTHFTDPSGEFVPALLGAVVAGAIIGGLVEYGGQMYEQHRTTGSIDWGAYCGEEIAIAMLGGGVAGGVGFLMGPWVRWAFGNGLQGTMIAGALEGAFSDIAVKATLTVLSGKQLSGEALIRAAIGGALIGGIGGGLRWSVSQSQIDVSEIDVIQREVFQWSRNFQAWQLRRGRQMVTRWRGTNNPQDISALHVGFLESKAQRLGIPTTALNRSFPAKFWHSITSDTPPSQFVSLTRNPQVAQAFGGRVFEFHIRKRDLNRAWWNMFGEAEDLALGGTRIYHLRELP